MDFDCIVIGGGPAGLSAALLLGRSRRSALLIDSGAPRNAASHAMHGVLGHDGLHPAALRERGLEELSRYDIAVREAEVGEAEAFAGGVRVNGATARTLILATGMLDDTPDIPGFAEIYGVSAHTCPYCDGWEHRDQRIAVLADGPQAAHLGRLLPQWSPDVTVLSADAEEQDVPVIRQPVERFVSCDGQLTEIVLAGRDPLPADALFFHVAFRPRTTLAARLGCALDENGYVAADPLDRQTSVDRVYAAGNCADGMQNVAMAIADGARAAVMINFRLVSEGHYSSSKILSPLT
jgi:thioredoxin reductase